MAPSVDWNSMVSVFWVLLAALGWLGAILVAMVVAALPWNLLLLPLMVAVVVVRKMEVMV